MKLMALALALLATPALADDAACDTLAGFKHGCSVQDAGTVVGLAKARLSELNDCSQFKKKSELASCAAEATTLAQTLASAAVTLQKAANSASPGPGGRAARSNSNRMEAEETDE